MVRPLAPWMFLVVSRQTRTICLAQGFTSWESGSTWSRDPSSRLTDAIWFRGLILNR
jgi:hypothetical protein